jgi:hypothetical protein
MGIAGLGIIYGMNGKKREEKKYLRLAHDMALDWAERASNGDGSYRLAFDRPDTFSMKYNIVWDKLFGTEIMPKEMWYGETWANRRHFLAYGMPLDNRSTYTKSDWTVWTATLCPTKDEFDALLADEQVSCGYVRVPYVYHKFRICQAGGIRFRYGQKYHNH